jgi:DNA (cytosine-5)-methyltransferase 1
MLFNGQGRPIDLDDVAPTLPASMGGNRTPIIDQQQLESHAPCWAIDYHRRLSRGLPPIDTVPSRMRRLTVEEAAVLQGFPIDYCFVGSQCSKLRQIGNAVPPPLGGAVAAMLRRVLDSHRFTPEENQPELDFAA